MAYRNVMLIDDDLDDQEIFLNALIRVSDSSFIPLFNTAGKIYGVMNTGADVTDLNLAKQKIEKSEAQLRSLVMTAPVGICILKGNDFLVEVVNDSFLEVVGKSREAFTDGPYWEVLPEMANTHQPILENVLSEGMIYRGR